MAFTGISTLADEFKTQQNSYMIDWDVTKLNNIIQIDLARYNQVVQEQLLGDWAIPTTAQAIAFDGNSDVKMQLADEFQKTKTQMNYSRWVVSAPLDKYIASNGQTWDWFQTATVAEVSKKFIALQIADVQATLKSIRSSIYVKENVSYTDRWVNSVPLTVNKAWNNDGTTPPTNRDGKTFLSTHTHFLGSTSGSVAVADVDNLWQTVSEHNRYDNVEIDLHADDYATVSALSSFTALSNANLIYQGVVSTAMKQDQNSVDLSNTLIGFWGKTAAMIPVYIRPWAVSGYALCACLGEPGMKPLMYRQAPEPQRQGLKLSMGDASTPIILNQALHYFGVGVYDRSGLACLQLNNSTYTSPTIS